MESQLLKNIHYEAWNSAHKVENLIYFPGLNEKTLAPSWADPECEGNNKPTVKNS